MYLAPLNYDRFFKRVFSHDHIAKRFLEDFLQVKIETIERLPEENRVTDNAAKVIFDYRCKIDGHYVTIDMQQWFKTDVVKRFYLYHAVGTALQLEKLKPKTYQSKTGVKIITKDYNDVEPVITLIWMVDDILHYRNVNYIAFKMLPEPIEAFIRNDALWKIKVSDKNSKQILLEAREKMLKLLQNEHRELDFLGKNKLCFLFQHNIAKSNAIEAYKRWFDFAERTRDVNNTEGDFLEYQSDPIFAEIIRIINRHKLTHEDLNYITEEAEEAEQKKRFVETERKKGRAEGRREGREEGREETTYNGIVRALERKKLPVEEIAATFDVTVEMVNQIQQQLLKPK